jgi:hypothetical protein
MYNDLQLDAMPNSLYFENLAFLEPSIFRNEKGGNF